MPWLILIIAGLFETVWAVSMKYSEGLTRLWPSLITAAAMIISLWLLAIALKSLPLGTAYTIWTGIGALGTVIYGILIFGESKDLLKILFVMMILGGIIGLKVVSKESTAQKAEQSQPVGAQPETGNHTTGRP
ncbi:MAG: quaternary ammonium compound efflux SMR transporter SugE [Lentimicrobiaceae bacterium]|nr:quaternary ammonium compound efflux SMR transporter SugE [Lentimicrobiaceae bacterium]MCB9024179.1 quaternary ammonium compound efflux SMR transporter SugE [Lentimicrobiaceae bacterium]HPG34582.1 quaternary ammonium compound efflux SMR transporter SugE [Lentimicrobium sp.]